MPKNSRLICKPHNFDRETYEKQKIDVKAKTQEKKTAERALEAKVSYHLAVEKSATLLRFVAVLV